MREIEKQLTGNPDVCRVLEDVTARSRLSAAEKFLANELAHFTALAGKEGIGYELRKRDFNDQAAI